METPAPVAVRPAETPKIATTRTEAPRYSQEVEKPIRTLAERLAVLRREEIGKPIAVQKPGEDGQPSGDLEYVGHILPTKADSGQWHVVIMDNGMAAMTGGQYGLGGAGIQPEYLNVYNGNSPMSYPEGSTRAEIFADLAGSKDNRRYGGATYESTNNGPESAGKLQNSIAAAMENAGKIIRERRETRKTIAQFTEKAIDTALGVEEPASS